MKIYRLLSIALFAACLASCSPKAVEPKVMARFVPERSDDFVWENNLVGYRLYGQALEGETTSPGIDIWVKLPGKLVADEWYKAALTEPGYYHHDHGGKDCYKVGVSLGAGASAVLIDSTIQYPATNYRSYEVLEQTPDKVVFVLHYPQWEADGEKIALDKKITVTADTYFCECEDTYTFSGSHGDTLDVAAGIFLHPALASVEEENVTSDKYAIWEHASDQSAEPEDGMIGVAVYVPGAEWTRKSCDGANGLCVKKMVSGEPFHYYFGSCWSKGDIKTSADWFALVDSLR